MKAKNNTNSEIETKFHYCVITDITCLPSAVYTAVSAKAVFDNFGMASLNGEFSNQNCVLTKVTKLNVLTKITKLNKNKIYFAMLPLQLRSAMVMSQIFLL